jgi:hypothetical protein
MVDPENRLNAIREGAKGLRLALYLDLSDEDVIDWCEAGTCEVLALSREASKGVTKFLIALMGQDVFGVEDSAGLNVSRFLDMGIDRQMSLAGVIEGLFSSFSDVRDCGEPDPFAGLAAKREDDARKMRRLLRRYEEVRLGILKAEGQ